MTQEEQTALAEDFFESANDMRQRALHCESADECEAAERFARASLTFVQAAATLTKPDAKAYR